jgi:AcrR family transcriptional regulator
VKVTAEEKARTRQRILDAARRLFGREGIDRATTRDLAAEAEIAAGTLFNYFPSKEALAMALLQEAQNDAVDDFLRRRRGDESLAEELFALISAELRRLKPHRRYAAEAVFGILSPFAKPAPGSEGSLFREVHLAQIEEILRRHNGSALNNPLAIHLYWTLYLGVLSFWSRDDSPKQSDTLAVLDQATRLAADALIDSRPDEPPSIRKSPRE